MNRPIISTVNVNLARQPNALNLLVQFCVCSIFKFNLFIVDLQATSNIREFGVGGIRSTG